MSYLTTVEFEKRPGRRVTPTPSRGGPFETYSEAMDHVVARVNRTLDTGLHKVKHAGIYELKATIQVKTHTTVEVTEVIR